MDEKEAQEIVKQQEVTLVKIAKLGAAVEVLSIFNNTGYALSNEELTNKIDEAIAVVNKIYDKL